jgi:DNA mismatch repair protein MutS
LAKQKKSVAIKKEKKETPLMKQYNEIKEQYPDTILLFRVGDFYETFGSDAVTASKVLGIVLTKRANGSAAFIELAGFPHHSMDTYLPKLVRSGYRVAICDQLEDPKLTKKIVKRGVTEVVTPGIAVSDNVLNVKENNFLAAIVQENGQYGVSFIDVSTGEFYACQGSGELIRKLMSSYNPTEVIYARSAHREVIELIGEKYYFYGVDDWVLETNHTVELLLKTLKVKNLKGFGVKPPEKTLQKAAGLALHYIKQNHINDLSHVNSIHKINFHHFLWMDDFTIKNLELLSPISSDGKSLIEVIDKTLTPMGGRNLRKFLVFPSIDKAELERRYDLVAALLAIDTAPIQNELRDIRDINRITSKIALKKCNPKELSILKSSLEKVKTIESYLKANIPSNLHRFIDDLAYDESSVNLMDKYLVEDPAIAVGKGPIINEGIDKELDEYRSLSNDAKQALHKIQLEETERTGIPSLKIAYNNVFGYYLEVRNAHKDKVPEEWIRKQTLTQAERYITQELKEFEAKILSAEDKSMSIEARLLAELIQKLDFYCKDIGKAGDAVALVDTLLSFAELAKEKSYCRPTILEDNVLEIKQGRHPVIEDSLSAGDMFVPNDVYLNSNEQQIVMVTGPNMSGKSAILRQTAIISILAQIGCYVPAESFRFGLVDKLYTRVGASDNLAAGESTFMVEMTETATILNNITSSSLVLLDEIGRGTSTYDGVSIAQSIAEYLHDNGSAHPRTLFATHYHELNKLTETKPRIKNYNVAVKETEDGILFLRKLTPGGSQHSFGIHVAQMAGIPEGVVSRANVILSGFNQEKDVEVVSKPKKKAKDKSKDNDYQLSFIQLDDPALEGVREEVLNVDINNLTPVEALNKLNEIKKMLK